MMGGFEENEGIPLTYSVIDGIIMTVANIIKNFLLFRVVEIKGSVKPRQPRLRKVPA